MEMTYTPDLDCKTGMGYQNKPERGKGFRKTFCFQLPPPPAVNEENPFEDVWTGFTKYAYNISIMN